MDQIEYDKLLPTIPKEEHRAFQAWFIEYQDFVSWENFKKQGFRHALSVKNDVEQHILKVTGKPQQLKLAFMPTQMTRTSPFFPMSKADMKDRPLYQNFVIENRWGRITFSGPRLSIHDESVLLALLVLAKRHKSDHFETSYSEVCEVMGVSRGKNPYAAIGAVLKRLTMAVVDTELYKGNTEKKEVVRSITGPIVFNVDQETNSSKVTITLSPYFLGLYAANLTTSLDVAERSKLKSDIAKALYRFIRTHELGPVPFGLLTLAIAINLDIEQPLKEIRRQIKTALNELSKHNLLRSWKMDKNDNIFLSK